MGLTKLDMICTCEEQQDIPFVLTTKQRSMEIPKGTSFESLFKQFKDDWLLRSIRSMDDEKD